MSVAVYATSALCVGCLLNNVNECLCTYDSEEQSHLAPGGILPLPGLPGGLVTAVMSPPVNLLRSGRRHNYRR